MRFLVTNFTEIDKLSLFSESSLKSRNRDSKYALSCTLKVGNNTILIELNNEVQKEMLIVIKQDMLDTLRTILNNKNTQLDITVSENVGEVKAYKPADKFRLMAEKNPALLEFKKRFDLDIEY